MSMASKVVDQIRSNHVTNASSSESSLYTFVPCTYFSPHTSRGMSQLHNPSATLTSLSTNCSRHRVESESPSVAAHPHTSECLCMSNEDTEAPTGARNAFYSHCALSFEPHAYLVSAFALPLTPGNPCPTTRSVSLYMHASLRTPW